MSEKKSPAKMLLYKGSLYRLAMTDEERIIRGDIVPRVQTLLETLQTEDMPLPIKKDRAALSLRELRQLFPLVGL